MYEQTFEIEHRLTDLLRLIEEGRYSTPRLAELLQVSIPTVSRGIRALRGRGHTIKSTRLSDGSWCYAIDRTASKFMPARHARHASTGATAQSRVGT